MINATTYVMLSGCFFVVLTLLCLFCVIHIRRFTTDRDTQYRKQFQRIDNAIGSYNESVKVLIEQIRELSKQLKTK